MELEEAELEINDLVQIKCRWSDPSCLESACSFLYSRVPRCGNGDKKSE